MKNITSALAALISLFLTLAPAPSAFAVSALHAGHVPATGNYTAYCDGDYHSLRYCNFTNSFSVESYELATALSWYDLGCNAPDAAEMNFYFDLAKADTFEVVATTLQGSKKICNTNYPPGHNQPTTLPIPSTTLVPGQKYFILLRAQNNPRARAYWGVDGGLGSSFQIETSLDLIQMQQSGSQEGEAFSEGQMIERDSVMLRGATTAGVGDQFQIQAELRRFTEPFTGQPTASSSFVNAGQTAFIEVHGLIDGAYRWKMRAADREGRVSPWQEYGDSGNADFEVFTRPLPSVFPIPNPDCKSAVPFVPYAPMAVKAATFWTSCHDGSCRAPAYSRIFNPSSSAIVAQSDMLDQGFAYTQGAYDLQYTTRFSGSNQVILQPGKLYTFSNFESDGGDCTAGPFHPHSAYLEVAPPLAPKEPVVIVPGLMGSSLRRVSNDEESWPSANQMVFSKSDSYLDDLKFGRDGLQVAGKEMRPGALIRSASLSGFGIDLVSQPFYGNLMGRFIDEGYVLGVNLFEVPYDWRSDIKKEASRLQTVMETARALSPNGKVNIVAHSMGGLLVKQYMAASEHASSVDTIVLVGVPQLGAPIAFKALQYGDNLGFKYPVVNRDLLNAAEVKSIAQNMPGIYELLPTDRYVSLNGSYVKDFRAAAKALSRQDINAFMAADPNDSRNGALIAAAQEFHDALDEQSIQGPKVYNLAACGNPATLGEVRLYDKGKIDIGSTDGDGTVPLASAMDRSGQYENYFVSSDKTGIDHMGLIRDDRATLLIQRLLEGQAIEPVPGISTSSEVCANDGSQFFRFSTHSPVALHVYDNAGRHTGPAPDGSVEIGIPGSDYVNLAENSFTFVPVGGDYRVAAEGLSLGTFTLKAETLEGTKPIASTNYIDVPLSGASTTAWAMFSDSDMSPALSLDRDGNGVAEASVMPAARLEAGNAIDEEPPRIELAGLPTGTVAIGTPFRITFSADDALSGIATTSALLDGASFESGALLTVSAIGEHEIVIEATDKAGNPKIMRHALIAVAGYPASPASSTVPELPTSSMPSSSPASAASTSISQWSDSIGMYGLFMLFPMKFQLNEAIGKIFSKLKASVMSAIP